MPIGMRQESGPIIDAGDRRGDHEADIVPVAGVAAARIAEPDDEAHRRAALARIMPTALLAPPGSAAAPLPAPAPLAAAPLPPQPRLPRLGPPPPSPPR